MVIDSDSPPANPVADFEEFFRNFEEVPNEFKYRQKISEAYAKSERFVTILFEDVLNFRPNLANYLRNEPEQALEEAVEAFKNIYRIIKNYFYFYNNYSGGCKWILLYQKNLKCLEKRYVNL